MCKKRIFLIFILYIMLMQVPTYADVGSFERYSSGSSSSSSYRPSYSSSGYSSYSYYSNNNTRDMTGAEFLIFIGVFIGIVVIRCILDKRFDRKSYGYTNVPALNINSQEIDYTGTMAADKIKSTDPNFSKEEFLSWVRKIFMQLQNSWTARDWEQMRKIESEELFSQHERQLKAFIDKKQINVLDQIAINFANISSFMVEGEKEVVNVTLRATMKDYIIDEKTRRVLQGSKLTDHINTYRLVFTRKAGTVTKSQKNEVIKSNCPNCGAPMNITTIGKCEYCGSSVVTVEEGDWLLTNYERIV